MGVILLLRMRRGKSRKFTDIGILQCDGNMGVILQFWHVRTNRRYIMRCLYGICSMIV